MKRIVLIAFALAFALVACASIVGVEDPELALSLGPDGGSPLVDGGSPNNSDDASSSDDAGCLGQGCACNTDNDCAADTRYKSCVQNKCVECKVGPTPADDNCDNGSYCLASEDALNACAPGCKTNGECAILSPSTKLCNTTRHQCVECIGDGDCTGTGGGNKKCTPSGTCADTCISDGGASGCPNGQTCCTNLCFDLTTDVFNCKTCGAACTAGGSGARCCNSECKATLTDPTSCGACGITCTSANVKNANDVTCASGQCTYSTCKAGFADCNNDKKDGCECACPSKCASCTTSAAGAAVCNVSCNPGAPCKDFVCPTGMACRVRCLGTHACENTLVCPPGFACNLDCTGTQACNGMQINASQSTLCIDCTGTQACNGLQCDEGNLNCKQHCGASACNGACGNCSSAPSCL